MKTLRFVCAAFVAAMTLAGCHKETPASTKSNDLKSVEVKLNNVAPGTRAIGGLAQDLEGKNIQLNSLQFYFSDGTNLYEAKDAQGQTADVYFDSAELAAYAGNISAKFHFLPAAVKKVIIVGNRPEKPATNENDLNETLSILNCQDVTKLPLYAEGTLTLANSNAHNQGTDGHLSNVYSVTLDVYPPVSRFEITGIGCALPPSSEKIVKVVSLAFVDFYDNYDLRTGTLTTLRGLQMEQQKIYDYFQNQMSTLKWNNDFFNGAGPGTTGNSHPLIELTATNKSVTTDIAYNFFSKGPSPYLLLNIIEYDNQQALTDNNGTPGYLSTNVYRLNSSETVTNFEPGKIYRMAINFTEDDLQHQDRCLDISLKVTDWIVVNVTPEF